MTKRAYLVLLLVGITLVFGLATGFALFYRLVYILLLVLAGAFLWSRLSLWRLETQVDRQVKMAQVGDSIGERIRVSNPTWITKAWLEVEDLTDLPGHATGRVLTVPAHSFRSWRIETLCRRRGVYTLGPLRARSGDPFGLFQRERTFPGSRQIVVYPRIVELPTFRIPGSELPGDGIVKMRSLSTTPQVAGIREYLYGDNVNRIHWPSSLRLGKLMSKEFDVGFTTDTWLFLDFQAAVQAEIEEESTDETMVAAAASIAAKFLSMQLPVGLIAHGAERYFLQAQRGAAQMNHILEQLARARAEGTAPLEQALAAEERLFNRFSTLIILTPSSHQEWLTAVQVLQRRRIRVVVVLLDAVSFGGRGTPEHLLGGLAVHGVHSTVVHRGDDLDTALRGIQGSVFPESVAVKERTEWI